MEAFRLDHWFYLTGCTKTELWLGTAWCYLGLLLPCSIKLESWGSYRRVTIKDFCRGTYISKQYARLRVQSQFCNTALHSFFQMLWRGKLGVCCMFWIILKHIKYFVKLINMGKVLTQCFFLGGGGGKGFYRSTESENNVGCLISWESNHRTT